MDLRIQALCIDCTEPTELAAFWQEALGWRRSRTGPAEVILEPPAGSPLNGVAPDLVFLRTPTAKTTKNRLHLDLRPADQAAEVTRLENLGARSVDVGQGPEATWVVLADPEGNEFCVLPAYTPEELAVMAPAVDNAPAHEAAAVGRAAMDVIREVERTL